MEKSQYSQQSVFVLQEDSLEKYETDSLNWCSTGYVYTVQTLLVTY